RSIELEFHGDRPYLVRGGAYAALGDYAKALADFDAAAKIAPAHSFAFANRSAVYAKMGNIEKANADWDEAMRRDPTLREGRRETVDDPPKPPQRKKLSADD